MSALFCLFPPPYCFSVVARDGSQCVLGLSSSVPSRPGERERSPSEQFSPEGRRQAPPTSSSSSPPAEQGAKATVPVISIWSSGKDTTTSPTSSTSRSLVSSSMLYRQNTLESPCYQPSPHHRHPYQAVLPPSPPSPNLAEPSRTVTFASPPSHVEIVEFTSSSSSSSTELHQQHKYGYPPPPPST